MWGRIMVSSAGTLAEKKKINKEENYSKHLKKIKGIIIIMIIINTLFTFIDIYSI